MSESHEALVAALVELEHYVHPLGFDQPPRLFALADARDVVTTDPHLVEHLGVDDVDKLPVGALLAIEQDEFQPGADLPQALERIMWPDQVSGCAVTMVSAFVSAEFSEQMPEDPDEAAEWVSVHPQRQDMRVAVGVLRDGATHGIARLASHPEELLGGRDLVPGLTALLTHTLEPEPSKENEL